MWDARSISILLVGASLLMGGCGDATDTTARDAAAEAASQPTPEETFGFGDYNYQRVSKNECSGTARLGEADRLTIPVVNAKSGVGEYFKPNCITGVRRDRRLTIEVVNRADIAHNIIVKGNDGELLVQPGEKGEIEVELTAWEDGQIGFQCSIHAPYMNGAFFQ
jgi:hypothetical protein